MNNDTLPRWQAEFTHSLLSDLQDSIEHSIQHDSTHAKQQRFAIYQNNVFYSLSNALASLYPVIKALVGDDFFTGTAGYYLREHPPQQAAMVHFGHDFPAFLAQFEHTKNMTYLAPTAEVELARHKAYHSEDIEPLSIDTIAAMPPEDLAYAQCTLHPSLQLVQSSHPIFDIWQTNQEDNSPEESIDLNEPQQVLIVRPLYDVCMYNIDAGTYQFIDCLHHGHMMQDAIEITTATHTTFNVGEALNFALQTALFTHITLNKN